MSFFFLELNSSKPPSVYSFDVANHALALRNVRLVFVESASSSLPRLR